MIIYTLQQNCKTFKLMVNLAPIKKKMLIMRFKRLDKYFLKKKKKKKLDKYCKRSDLY